MDQSLEDDKHSVLDEICKPLYTNTCESLIRCKEVEPKNDLTKEQESYLIVSNIIPNKDNFEKSIGHLLHSKGDRPILTSTCTQIMVKNCNKNLNEDLTKLFNPICKQKKDIVENVNSMGILLEKHVLSEYVKEGEMIIKSKPNCTLIENENERTQNKNNLIVETLDEPTNENIKEVMFSLLNNIDKNGIITKEVKERNKADSLLQAKDNHTIDLLISTDKIFITQKMSSKNNKSSMKINKFNEEVHFEKNNFDKINELENIFNNEDNLTLQANNFKKNRTECSGDTKLLKHEHFLKLQSTDSNQFQVKEKHILNTVVISYALNENNFQTENIVSKLENEEIFKTKEQTNFKDLDKFIKSDMLLEKKTRVPLNQSVDKFFSYKNTSFDNHIQWNLPYWLQKENTADESAKLNLNDKLLKENILMESSKQLITNDIDQKCSTNILDIQVNKIIKSENNEASKMNINSPKRDLVYVENNHSEQHFTQMEDYATAISKSDTNVKDENTFTGFSECTIQGNIQWFEDNEISTAYKETITTDKCNLQSSSLNKHKLIKCDKKSTNASNNLDKNQQINDAIVDKDFKSSPSSTPCQSELLKLEANSTIEQRVDLLQNISIANTVKIEDKTNNKFQQESHSKNTFIESKKQNKLDCDEQISNSLIEASTSNQDTSLNTKLKVYCTNDTKVSNTANFKTGFINNNIKETKNIVESRNDIINYFIEQVDSCFCNSDQNKISSEMCLSNNNVSTENFKNNSLTVDLQQDPNCNSDKIKNVSSTIHQADKSEDVLKGEYKNNKQYIFDENDSQIVINNNIVSVNINCKENVEKAESFNMCTNNINQKNLSCYSDEKHFQNSETFNGTMLQNFSSQTICKTEFNSNNNFKEILNPVTRTEEKCSNNCMSIEDKHFIENINSVCFENESISKNNLESQNEDFCKKSSYTVKHEVSTELYNSDNVLKHNNLNGSYLSPYNSEKHIAKINTMGENVKFSVNCKEDVLNESIVSNLKNDNNSMNDKQLPNDLLNKTIHRPNIKNSKTSNSELFVFLPRNDTVKCGDQNTFSIKENLTAVNVFSSNYLRNGANTSADNAKQYSNNIASFEKCTTDKEVNLVNNGLRNKNSSIVTFIDNKDFVNNVTEENTKSFFYCKTISVHSSPQHIRDCSIINKHFNDAIIENRSLYSITDEKGNGEPNDTANIITENENEVTTETIITSVHGMESEHKHIVLETNSLEFQEVTEIKSNINCIPEIENKSVIDNNSESLDQCKDKKSTCITYPVTSTHKQDVSQNYSYQLKEEQLENEAEKTISTYEPLEVEQCDNKIMLLKKDETQLNILQDKSLSCSKPSNNSSKVKYGNVSLFEQIQELTPTKENWLSLESTDNSLCDMEIENAFNKYENLSNDVSCQTELYIVKDLCLSFMEKMKSEQQNVYCQTDLSLSKSSSFIIENELTEPRLSLKRKLNLDENEHINENKKANVTSTPVLFQSRPLFYTDKHIIYENKVDEMKKEYMFEVDDENDMECDEQIVPFEQPGIVNKGNICFDQHVPLRIGLSKSFRPKPLHTFSQKPNRLHFETKEEQFPILTASSTGLYVSSTLSTVEDAVKIGA